MFCPKCGNSNDDSAKFCSGCGNMLPQAVKDAPPPQTEVDGPRNPDEFHKAIIAPKNQGYYLSHFSRFDSPHMKPVIVAALFLIVLLNSVPPAFAAEKIDCSGISFTEVRSLVELPTEVGALLGTGRRGAEGIADRGAKYNATDVILDEQLPWRRFGLAAVSASCILVAIEHGGRGYSVELWAFAYGGDRWHGEQRQSIFSVPRSMQELIAHASK